MRKKLRQRLSYANVMSTVAVFIALGGSSYAALQIGSDDIADWAHKAMLAMRDYEQLLRGIDPASGMDDAPDERRVLLVDLAIVKLSGQLLVRLVVLGDHHQPGRVAVEPVHDAGAVRIAARRSPLEQPVDERTPRVSWSRVDDDAGRLVDDEEMLVLVGDAQRHFLRPQRGSLGVHHLAAAAAEVEDEVPGSGAEQVELALLDEGDRAGLVVLEALARLGQEILSGIDRHLPGSRSGSARLWLDRAEP
jgi:hypothetical protein